MHNVPNFFSGASVSAGNTSGTLTLVSSGTVYVAGGNNITISQNGNSLTWSGINAGAQSMSFWQNLGVNGSATDNMAQTRLTHGELLVFQLDIGNNIFAGNMTVNTVLFNVTVNNTGTIGSHATTVLMGLYTVNGSNLSLHNSGSVSFGSTNSGSHNAGSYYHGKRFLTMNSSVFSTNLTLSQTLYYAAVAILTAGTSLPMSFFGAYLGESGQRSGTIGVQSSNATYLGQYPFMGVYNGSVTALPVSIASNSLRKTALVDVFVPHIIFNNIMATF